MSTSSAFTKSKQKQKFLILIAVAFILLAGGYLLTDISNSPQLSLEPITHYLSSKEGDDSNPQETTSTLATEDNSRSEDAKIAVVDSASLVKTKHVEDASKLKHVDGSPDDLIEESKDIDGVTLGEMADKPLI